MNTLTDEETALLAHVENSTTEQIAEELKTLRDGLHQAKEVCNNARLRLPEAIENIEQGMSRLGLPHEVTKPIMKAFESVVLTLADMKNVQPMPVTEKQVVQFMADFVANNKIDHISIQYTLTNKKVPTSRENLQFYCNKRGHSGMSSKSIDDSLGKLGVYMDKQGANR